MTVVTKALVVPFSYSSLTIFLSRLTRFWMSVLSVMSFEIHEDDARTIVLHFVEH